MNNDVKLAKIQSDITNAWIESRGSDENIGVFGHLVVLSPIIIATVVWLCVVFDVHINYFAY